jgi:hypothetical protein
MPWDGLARAAPPLHGRHWCAKLRRSLQTRSLVNGQAIARESGQGTVTPAKLIGPMLARFMGTDRAFAKMRRTPAASKKP